jgi:TolB-like protein/Flp pilus assembly protein TadD
MAQKKNIKSFISNPLVQTFLIYVSGGWIVLEMTDYFINNYGLSETFRDVLLIILLAGLPLAIFLSWYLNRYKEEAKEKEIEQFTGKKAPDLFKVMLKKPWFSIPGTILFLLIVVSLIRLVYRHSSSLADNLEKSSAEISLAVLPFTNYTGDVNQEWLVAGQHETLINELSKISQVKPLRVISRHTVNAFKDFNRPIPEIARKIDVEFLVEASVLSFGDSITLQLRLIHAYPEENVVWAESCSSDFTNILNLHSGIARDIAEKMNLDLSSEKKEHFPIQREVNPESYKAYLRGMYNLNTLTPEGMEKGLEYLHEAVRLDSMEPFAYAGLALGYLEIAHGPLDPGDALPKAEDAVVRALKLDSTMAEIYAALAEVYLYKLNRFEESERYFIKALELNPNLALTHYHYAWALYLFGRMEEAITEHQLAKKYDPFNPLHTAWLGQLYFIDGQYEKALETANESFEIRKDYPVGYIVLGNALFAMGETEKALETHRKLAELYPPFSVHLGLTYAKTGHREEAEKILNSLLEDPYPLPSKSYQIAKLAAVLGESDIAFEHLNREPYHGWRAWAAVGWPFINLHHDPRWAEFIDGLNLPE